MMQPLVDKWAQIASQVNLRNTRERALIAVSCWAIVYLLWELVVFAPLNEKKSDLGERFEAVNAEMVQLSAQQQVFVQALTADPNAGRRREIAAQQERITQVDNEINRLSDGLIPADKLPQLLHDVLLANKSLSLVSLRALPSERLPLPYLAEQEELLDGEGDDLPSTTDPIIFKHGVKMSLRGNYFDVLHYLQSIENLQWRVYWELLDYEVQSYPKANVQLLVYTLSTDRGVFGE